jgi:hypothetical protein
MITSEFHRLTGTVPRSDIDAALANLMAAGIAFSEVATCGDDGCAACSRHDDTSVGVAA